MARKINRFCNVVDAINEWVGKTSRWLIVPLTLIVTIEVVARYVFSHPTLWAWDINIMLLAALGSLTGGYVLLHRGHVMVDTLVTGLSPRKKAGIDLLTSLFFLLAVGGLLWVWVPAAWDSVQTRETYSTFWQPPIYPIRIVITLGIFLLLLQGIAKILRDVIIVASVTPIDQQAKGGL